MSSQDISFDTRVRIMHDIAHGMSLETIEAATGYKITLLGSAYRLAMRHRPGPKPDHLEIATLRPGKVIRYSIAEYCDVAAIVRRLNHKYNYKDGVFNPDARWVMVYGEPGWFGVKRIGASKVKE